MKSVCNAFVLSVSFMCKIAALVAILAYPLEDCILSLCVSSIELHNSGAIATSLKEGILFCQRKQNFISSKLLELLVIQQAGLLGSCPGAVVLAQQYCGLSIITALSAAGT